MPEYNTAEERRNVTFVKNNKIMATLQIHSNNAADLNLLNEMARRMNLKTEIKIPEPETNAEHDKPVIDYEDTPERIVEKIKMGLKEVKERNAGKRKLKTLEQLLDENRD